MMIYNHKKQKSIQMKKSRKDDVIKTANCIIRKVGFSNLSFSQIATTLGVTRENVHHYFRKKESLGNACLDAMYEDLDDKFEKIMILDISADKKLLEYFKIYKTQQDEREDCPIVSLLAEFDLLPISMKEQVKKLVKIEQTNMEKILEEGKANCIFFFNESIETKALMSITLLKGTVSYSKIYDNFKDMSSLILEELLNQNKS